MYEKNHFIFKCSRTKYLRPFGTNNSGSGAGKTFATLKDAWDAARTDTATHIIINIAEGTYVEAATLTATTGKNITFVGAGADKTIVKRSATTTFTLPGTPGYVATKPNRLLQLNAGSDNLKLTFEKMSFQTIGYNDANGGGVINADGLNQQFTFRYCNFSNIMARAGAIIQVQGSDTLLVASIGIFSQNEEVKLAVKVLDKELKNETYPPAKVNLSVTLFKNSDNKQYLEGVRSLLKLENPELLRITVHLLLTLDTEKQLLLADDIEQLLTHHKKDKVKEMSQVNELMTLFLHKVKGKPFGKEDQFW